MIAWVKRNWWLIAIGVVLIYTFKPGWLKFKQGGGPVGGPTAAAQPGTAAGTGGEF